MRVLLLACLLLPAAHAQAPHVLNGPPLPSAERLRAFDARTDRGGTPDTTAPWRYYPLAVGNAWEYRRFPTGLPHVHLGYRRMDIEKDTLIAGTRYVIHRLANYDENGNPSSGSPQRRSVRFDTLTATVRGRTLDGSGEYLFEPCPFDAPFDATVVCEDGLALFYTAGGYDAGTLTFPDTSFAVTYKAYGTEFGDSVSYAAGYGESASEHHLGETRVLEYVRVGDEEYGSPLYPLANELPPELVRPTLSVWPSPAQGRVTVAFTPVERGVARLELYDALGRRVRTRAVAVLPDVRVEIPLDLGGLAPGVYSSASPGRPCC